MFNKDSRYFPLKTHYHEDDMGHLHPYKARRFLPKKAKEAAHISMPIVPNQRLDIIAAKIMGKPESFWKIADANADINVFDLLKRPDQRLNVPVKKG